MERQIGRIRAAFGLVALIQFVLMILAKNELKSLTGYMRSSAQVRWLRRHGWRFVVNALGEPVVAVAEFNRHLVGGKAAAKQELNLRGIND